MDSNFIANPLVSAYKLKEKTTYLSFYRHVLQLLNQMAGLISSFHRQITKIEVNEPCPCGSGASIMRR